MGRAAKLELLRRLLALGLGILGLWGGLTFLTPLSSGLCFAAAVAIYFAIPRPRPSPGAVRPDAVPNIWISDCIGFLIGVPLFSAAFTGAATGGQGSGVFFLLLLLPASMCVPVFLVVARQETSWVRFFNNGFEITQMGLTARVRFSELLEVDLKHLKATGGGAWMMGLRGGDSRRRVALLSAAKETKTLIFKAANGDEFSISCEVIPDLNRVLVGLDKEGVALPRGFAERQKKRTRRLKEKIYGKTLSVDAQKSVEKLDAERIAETIRRYRQRKLASG
ncbi:hypothetical protein [Roseibium limicola]|uniref:Uncharacterized protein n=1 Tax=Roseibium limicola TaxID=2816037 RepID=A0A939EQB9_9HYPH|nr:hypothetical protein [Roseibium limicola]MBO0346573.1 hypothetical protein [Roseibium limicola]